MKCLFYRVIIALAIAVVINHSGLAEEKAATGASYEKMLYDLGAFPVAKLTQPYSTNGNPGKVYRKGQRVDVDGWLPPYSAPGYLTDAEKAQYGIPKKPLTYKQYVALLDIDTYKRTHDPMLFLVMRFALESMAREEVRVRKEDILRVYEARIGLEEFAVRLLREQLSSADAMRLIRNYGDEKLFAVLPSPQPADKAYVAFLTEQASAPRRSISCRQDAYKLLFAMDENAYRKPYRKFLLSHVQMAKDWWVRASLYDDLVRLKDAESMKAIQEALVHDPITECREAILYDLKEQGEVASAIDAILIVANGQDEKPHPVTPSRMEMGWTHCLTEYLKWAKSQKGLDVETSRKVNEAIERLQGSETPQELIATYRHALAAKDWRRCFLCYDPKMRGDLLVRLFYALGGRDTELAAIVKKRLRIEFSDPERMTIPGLCQDDRVPKEILFYEAIQKQVDDLPGFVDEMCRRLDAMGQKAFSKLGDVREIRIQGDRAVGYWSRPPSKSTGQPVSDNRVPVHFYKIGGKWYLVIPDPPPPLSVSERAKLLKTEVKSLFVYLCCSDAAFDPFAEPSQPQTAQPSSEKRYDELRLSVLPVYGGNAPTVHVAQVTEAQVNKLIDYLAAEGYLNQAVELGKQDAPERDLSQNCYTLQVSTSNLQLHEDLGWGPLMLRRLDGLRGALDGEPARAMDAILAGLADERKQWATATAEPPAPHPPVAECPTVGGDLGDPPEDSE